MTICIAAICENGKHIVVAADRMFTIQAPLNIEFEPKISKMQKMASGCLALPSGPALYADELLKRILRQLHSNTGASVRQVCEMVANGYAQFRDEKHEETNLLPLLGRDFKIFRERGGFIPNYLQTQPGIYQQVVITQQQFNLNLDVMIAGIDNTECHIGAITHPGTLYFFDKLGYNAIGSGAVHAATKFHLGGQTPGASLEATLYAVYDAKRASEVAPGVGRETELAVISNGDIWPCPPELLQELKTIHEEAIKKSEPKLEGLRKKYDESRKTR